MNTVVFALGLTVFAGLATGVGSALAFVSKKFNPNFLSGALGFSAGVMIYVFFIEIFIKARDSLRIPFGNTKGYWITSIAFFGGIAVIAIIDKLIPAYENPHEIGNINETPEAASEKRLFRMGVFSALAIAIHNFPEGIATFMGALSVPTLGISIAVAIAIHNIPEGVAVSVPIYYATKSRKKAFWLSFASGLAEPVRALLGYGIECAGSNCTRCKTGISEIWIQGCIAEMNCVISRDDNRGYLYLFIDKQALFDEVVFPVIKQVGNVFTELSNSYYSDDNILSKITYEKTITDLTVV